MSDKNLANGNLIDVFVIALSVSITLSSLYTAFFSEKYSFIGFIVFFSFITAFSFGIHKARRERDEL
jgi:hypothetical protein